MRNKNSLRKNEFFGKRNSLKSEDEILLGKETAEVN
jgi:hypothetical protein